jgi:hypothetical protein
VFSAPLPTANGVNYVVSWWVRREGLANNVFCTVGATTKSNSLAVNGTPGRSNSVAASWIPVGISVVSHLYDICAVGATNVVRARLAQPGSATNVQFFYRAVATNTYQFSDGAYNNLAMRDDGVAPDLTASDGEFAVYGPVVTSNYLLVRYHVAAFGTNGLMAMSPHLDDPSADYGYWVESNPKQNVLPEWHLMVDGDPVFYPIVRRACVVSPEGQVFTDIKVRHRGRIPSSLDNRKRTGIGVRMHRGRLLDAWFAKNQDGINFRNRIYPPEKYGSTDYARVVNEPLGYDLQRLLGLPTPRIRHVCIWINGNPSITVELEDPGDAFLTGTGLSLNDYASRGGYTGRQMFGGNVLIDNFDSVEKKLKAVGDAAMNTRVRNDLCYESVQYSLALLGVTCNGDQHLDWNMIQHRSASDRRWRQYPWDVDQSFRDEIVGDHSEYLPNLHPYYQTSNHPSVWAATVPGDSYLLGNILFDPESGTGSEYTLPYRHRQQMTLWRFYYTVNTTNFLYPKLNAMQSSLTQALAQVGLSITSFTDQLANAKGFIPIRRNFLMNGTWSDKNTNIWKTSNVYNPSNVVINEIMYNQPATGGEYLELYNPGMQAIDLSWWLLRIGQDDYHLPLGTMLGPTGYLVIADFQVGLTNAYAELGNGSNMVPRYPGYPLWDWPSVWTSATEYASRVVEIPNLGLPNDGAAIMLFDLCSNVIDTVIYTNGPPWPVSPGVSLELINPGADNAQPTNWCLSSVIGTPGYANSATLDTDQDGLTDSWEQRIVAASGGAYTSIAQVLPADDFDGDGLSNLREFILGTDPTVRDDEAAALDIHAATERVTVSLHTFAPTGAAYQLYKGRYYTLEQTPQLVPTDWRGILNFIDIPGTGGELVYSNAWPGTDTMYYQGLIRLQSIR